MGRPTDGPKPPPVELYNLACIRARMVPLAEGDRDQAVARALGSLRLAIDAGYRDVANMSTDVDLESLRQHGEFKKLLAELKDNTAKEVKQP